MKICQYTSQSLRVNQPRLAIIDKSGVYFDVNYTWKMYFELEGNYNSNLRAHRLIPNNLSEFLKFYQGESIDKLQETSIKAQEILKSGVFHTKDKENYSFHPKDIGDIQLACPLSDIPSYRDFYAHEKHVSKGFEKRGENIPDAWYEMPVYYKGETTGFIGDGETIPWPSFSKKLDYELELACVILKDGKSVTKENAKDYILGFTILNDVSARDIQKKEMSTRLGPAKGKDWCSVLGPVIMTIDEFKTSNPNLKMEAVINGNKWSSGQSGDANFSWDEMISHLSNEEWIRAGDLLGSGTVGTGCGLELDKWVQPGDKVELTIENIGTLTNIIGAPNGKL